MAEINISGLVFRYPGDQAFEMTVSDLRIASGKCVAIVGPSGSGKTTLLSLVAGIQVPQEGAIQIGETRVNELGESDRREFRIQKVGQVFQAFELLEYLSVIENVLLGSIIDPNIVKDARERAAGLLDSVGLSHKTHSKPAQLSHGERQRVAVCRAMLNDPKLLFRQVYGSGRRTRSRYQAPYGIRPRQGKGRPPDSRASGRYGGTGQERQDSLLRPVQRNRVGNL